jgi:hypothetical protein
MLKATPSRAGSQGTPGVLGQTKAGEMQVEVLPASPTCDFWEQALPGVAIVAAGWPARVAILWKSITPNGLRTTYVSNHPACDWGLHDVQPWYREPDVPDIGDTQLHPTQHSERANSTRSTDVLQKSTDPTPDVSELASSSAQSASSQTISPTPEVVLLSDTEPGVITAVVSCSYTSSVGFAHDTENSRCR